MTTKTSILATIHSLYSSLNSANIMKFFTRTTATNTPISMDSLKTLNTQLECNCGCSKSGFARLKKILRMNIEPGLLMYANYLSGKYLSKESKETGNVHTLDNARASLEKIFTIANNSGLRVRSPKFIFKTAHTNYLLAQKKAGENRTFLLNRALILSDQACLQFPDNASFKWLRNEVDTMLHRDAA